MINFENSIFTTEYSFSSPRIIIRALSDAFSKQHCDTKGAIKYGAKKTKGRCLYCGKPMYNLDSDNNPIFSNVIHYDHVYPASKFNLFEVGNIAIACNTCNISKSDRFPMEYYDIRHSEGLSLLIYDREEFKQFLHELTEPYRTKWPKHFAAGSRIIEDEKEFKKTLTELLYEPVRISPSSSKYNHENSVNRDVWNKVVKRAYETYSDSTAKDVEGRVGYTNEMFEDTLGYGTKIHEVSLKDLNRFINKLLLSKYESKNEIQKYRMLIKMLIEVLNEDLMEGQLEGFYKNVPTYSELSKSDK